MSTNASVATSKICAADTRLMAVLPSARMLAAAKPTGLRPSLMADFIIGSFRPGEWNERSQRALIDPQTDQGEIMHTRKAEKIMRNSTLDRRLSATDPQGPKPSVGFMDKHRAQGSRYGHLFENTTLATHSRPKSEVMREEKQNETRTVEQTTSGHYAGGYAPSVKSPWKLSLTIRANVFCRWVWTPAGFFITIYGLNVVAWGGMLFLLLCNAAPATCIPDCHDINSPRRKWIEIDSQILNALFCVTGFGLAPWRFRDIYWWAWWRLGNSERKEIGIRRLAGIHRGWFRLLNSDQLADGADSTTVDPKNTAVPVPVRLTPDPPSTGIRARSTKGWKMDLVIWSNASNTMIQAVLCFFMYHYNRFDRPSWATGTFVALGGIAASIAGITIWHEGKNVKKIECIPACDDCTRSPNSSEI